MMIHPLEKVPAWKKETAYDRARVCLSMLSIHEFMTRKEEQKVLGRLMKWRYKFENQPLPKKNKDPYATDDDLP